MSSLTTFRLILLMASVVVFNAISHARDCVYYSNYVHLENLLYVGGSVQDMFIINDRAYLASSQAGLQIFDIQTPAMPYLLDELILDGNALGLTVSGDYAYVAADTAGLQIVRIFPWVDLAASQDLPGTPARNVVIVDNYAYVAANFLFAIDISYASFPTPIDTLHDFAVLSDIAVSENNEYLACVDLQSLNLNASINLGNKVA